MEPAAKDIVLFADLDDTLFQTLRKDDKGIHQATHPVSEGKASFFTESQKLMVDFWLSNPRVELIPVTARTREQYMRTVFAGDPRIRFASVYYGSEILTGNEKSAEYESHLRNNEEGKNYNLEAAVLTITRLLDIDPAWTDVGGYYAVIPGWKSSELPDLGKESGLSEHYRLYTGPKGLVVLPVSRSKGVAVAWLRERLRPSLCIGAGDGIADLDFLRGCDFSMIPAAGKLNSILFNSSLG